MSDLCLPTGNLAFWVPLPAVRSKSNYRHQRHAGKWDRLRAFEDEVLLTVRAALPDGWDVGDANRPLAERPVVVACVAARTLLDAGNISKSVLDAAQGVVYHSDASVRAVSEFTQRARLDQDGAVGFALLRAGCSDEEVLEVLSALPRALHEQWRPQQER